MVHVRDLNAVALDSNPTLTTGGISLEWSQTESAKKIREEQKKERLNTKLTEKFKKHYNQ